MSALSKVRYVNNAYGGLTLDVNVSDLDRCLDPLQVGRFPDVRICRVRYECAVLVAA